MRVWSGWECRVSEGWSGWECRVSEGVEWVGVQSK